MGIIYAAREREIEFLQKRVSTQALQEAHCIFLRSECCRFHNVQTQSAAARHATYPSSAGKRDAYTDITQQNRPLPGGRSKAYQTKRDAQRRTSGAQFPPRLGQCERKVGFCNRALQTADDLTFRSFVIRSKVETLQTGMGRGSAIFAAIVLESPF